ncbi:hypothetical protein QEZ47_19980 [Aminobacter anthyllidis]|uniref:hypothetical protein n=1 Tax=Aminobacter anthyllidis TaxID=1035067 RepID=UPI002454C59C|nr:hypothetical protein [Aminobacter anthyllidis]MDH4987757.1 hypothetical protein [Aminobacter anthyllidis]
MGCDTRDYLRYAIAAATLALTACSAVNSQPVTQVYTSGDGQKAGVYYLPKHLLNVKLYGDKTSQRIVVASTPVQDRRLALETGLALSPLSDDDITVDYENGLLKSVSATLTDRTADILVEVAKLVVRLRDTPISQPLLKDISFDPFSYRDAMAVNASLSQHNSCVEVEVAPGLWSPGCGKHSLGTTYVQGAMVDTTLPPRAAPGIYYRRPASLMVHVVEKGVTTQLVPHAFANGSPMFRIDIRRTLFVARATTITFVDGALTQVKVNKPSEGLAIAQLPLKIIEATVNSATGGVAGARSTRLQSQASLNDSEAALNKVVAARLAAGDNVDALAPRSTVLPSPRSAALTADEMANCERIKFASEDCLRYYAE